MLTIHKQPLQPGLNHLSLPLGAQVLHADMQGLALNVWYLRPVIAPTMENRMFLWTGTGHDIHEPTAGKTWRHIASLVDRAFDWHIFELVNEPTPASGEQLAGEGR